ncbi:MAG: hypothetical protein E7Z83_02140 [Methanobrevibacter sp.]|nr:hypothetical protein [Methanobrevibacter sp.]MBE6489638.1 hypothetical protein [Methanobrevibacter sp.]
MEKKHYILIAAIIIILLIGFSVFNGSLNFQKEVKVGNSIFTLPNGYTEGSVNSNGDINLTNGTNAIFIKEYNESINSCVDAYKNFKTKNNYSIKVQEFNIDTINGYKSTISNESNTHYWFSYNNKTYCIYSWDENNNLDTTVIELMKTVQ